ncbi:MAG: CDP-archaeol synthase [Deltaproteobacteria bacterium]|nr:CDP-archaeol synthase [Deltaproteobacteria bacterium]MBW2073796.1 CDP-archaeol synthase [Deltaproteobacteria bacterium]
MLKMTCQILFLGSPLLMVAIAQGLCIKYNRLRWLRRPLDLDLRFRGKRIFGDHKTWRGLVINVAFCILGARIQGWIQSNGLIASWLPLLDYSKDGGMLGLLLGLGVTAGELPNSFLKRQLGISPGKRGKRVVGMAFFLFDQLDLAIGAWVFIYLIVKPSPYLILWSLVLTLVLHVMVSSVGYVLGMRKTIV